MARKHQQGDRPTGAPAGGGIDPNVALFASYVRDGEQRERDAKKAARVARQQAEAAQQLVVAKDAAAAEVKRLRSREGVSAEQRAAADAAYREALAAVVAAETGTAPAWAPAPAEPDAAQDERVEDDAREDDAREVDALEVDAEPVAAEVEAPDAAPDPPEAGA